MADQIKRSPGRPAKNPGERRTTHTFRVRETTRQRLIESAKASGRSVSEEIEWRVEHSFDQANRIISGVGQSAGASTAQASGRALKFDAADVGRELASALRKTLKPELLQPEKDQSDEGEHNPPGA